MLAKKIATARYNHQPEPFKKVEFPSLRDFAVDIVATNFSHYPELTGLRQPYRDQVDSKF